MIRVYGLGYRVYVLGFVVYRLWFMVYKTLVNSFNKHLNKSYKIVFKML